MEKSPVLTTFERKVNGESKKFWIQTVPDDKKEYVLDYYSKYFLRDEPICKSLKIIEDKESINYMIKLWRSIFDQDTVLVCFTELGNGEKEIVAMNMCYRASTDEKTMLENEKIPDLVKTILDTIEYVNKMKDIPKEIGATEYLGALGLLTLPEYRGFNIGLELLKARKLICDKLGLKASVTCFTAPSSQRLAEKAGFKDLVSITYDDLAKLRPASKFENINEYSKCYRNMYIRYQ